MIKRRINKVATILANCPGAFPVWVLLLGGVLAAWLPLSIFAQQPPKAKAAADTARPNIILIMADDLGWGDVGFNGNGVIQTPELDKMAASGVRFSRFYAAAPVCSPTRGSVLTGRHPDRYGIYSANIGHMKEEEFTLAEALKKRGYVTGHFGKWHLGTLTQTIEDGRRGGRDAVHYSPPWENGFDVCFSTEVAVPTWDPMEDQPFESKYWTGPDTYASENLEGDDSKIIMDRALPFIEKAANEEQPFFTVIWFHAPHSPVVAGPEYRKLYAQYDENKQHYYGCITAMDEQIGRLRAALRQMDVAGNTMIFFASDNGPAGEGGGIKQQAGKRQQGTAGPFRGRKGSLYEGGVRVPALLEWPAGLTSHGEIAFPLSTSDYVPTILSLLNGGSSAGRESGIGREPLDGINMLPVLRGDLTERTRPLFFRFRNRQQLACIEQEFKLYSSDDGESYELYNLLEDPGETNDLAAEMPEKISEMVENLQNWVADTERSEAGRDYLGKTAPGADQPNVLFLLADDMRYNTIHALNNEHIITPNLDELSRQSVVFRNAYILGGMNAAVCAPSRAMLMTGRELFQIPVGVAIPEGFITMPQAFRESGYQTFGTGKWHNGRPSYARSFANGGNILFGGMANHYQLPLYTFDPTGEYAPASRRDLNGTHSSTIYANTAITFLKDREDDAPFFMYIAFQAPHDPRQAPEAYIDMYDTAAIDLPPNFLPEHPFNNGELDVRDELLAGFPRRSSEIKEHIRDYYAMITHLDHEIGRVIQALKASGEFDNTIIVFSGDNGLAVGQHGLMGKQNLYEHSIKVPLMIAGPGIRGRQLDELICLSDLFPTLADMANIPLPRSVNGYSYTQVINGTGTGKRESLYFAYKNFQRAYRRGDWKLITYNVKGVQHEQLFNLRNDPWETEDLHLRNPKKARALKTDLQRALIGVGDSVRFNEPHWGVRAIPSWAEKVKRTPARH